MNSFGIKITNISFLFLFVFVTYVGIFYSKTYGDNLDSKLVYDLISRNIVYPDSKLKVYDFRIGVGDKTGKLYVSFEDIIKQVRGQIGSIFKKAKPCSTENISTIDKKYLNETIKNVCEELNKKSFAEETLKISSDYLMSLLFPENVSTSESIQKPQYFIAKIPVNDYSFNFLMYYLTPYVLSSLLSGIGGSKNISCVFNKFYFYTDKFYHRKIIPIPLRLGICKNFGVFNLHLIGFDGLSFTYFFILKFFVYLYDKYRCSRDQLYTIVIYGDNFFFDNLTNLTLFNSIIFLKIDIKVLNYWHISFNLLTCLLCFIYKFSQPSLNKIRNKNFYFKK